MPQQSKRLRVFLGLTEVAGYYRSLERGFRDIGVDARFFDLSANRYRYGKGTTRPAAGIWSGAAGRFQFVRRVVRGAWKVVARAALFVWAVLRYDVVIFSGPDSFFWYRDLPVLKALGKRIVYVFNGSDHRPPYLNGKLVRSEAARRAGWLAEETRLTKDRVRRVEQSADHVVALSASAQLHTRPFVHFLRLGLPVQPGPKAAFDENEHHDLIVLHAPSDPVSKGSADIRRYVEALRSEGREIEYVELVGQANAVVLAEIQRSDFVVDEMYSDTPMASFATEAAWAAKPAVLSGLYADQLRRDLPEALIPPTLFVVPEDLAAAIGRMADDPDLRRDLGRQAHRYVTRQWSPAAVAERFMALIEGRAPADWFYDPKDLIYFGGWGLTAAMVRDSVRAMIAEGGVGSLQLGDNPQLLARVLEFVQ